MTGPSNLDDVLPFGPAPRPTTGADVARRVHDALRDLVEEGVTGLDQVLVEAALDGPDVTTLDVDLTGVSVRLSRGGAASPPHEPWRPEVVGPGEDATVRRARLEAHPLVVEDVPVDVTVLAEGLRFVWVETTDGRLGVAPEEPDEAHPVTGHVRVGVPQDAVVDTARRLLATELATQGLALSSLDVEIAAAGPRAVTVRAFARVRKGILSASIHAALVADVDHRMVLTVREIDLSSRNPVVAALLVVARRQVDEVRGRTVDLAAELPAGVRLGDVHLDVDPGGAVTLTARFV